MSGKKGKLELGFLIDRWQPERGGAERALADFAGWLAERGQSVHVFAVEGPRAGERASGLQHGALHLVRAPRAPSRGARERELGRTLVDAAREQGCDVTIGVRHLPCVDLYWPHGGSHAATLAALADARAARRAPARGRHRAFLDLERALLEDGGARAIACVSKLVHDELAEIYPSARPRLRLVPNGVDVERFHPRERQRRGAQLRAALEVDARTPLLTFSARNPALKGAPALFRALARLGDRRWRLLVAGPRDVGRWRRAARAAGHDGARVTVVAEADPVALAAASDLCVLPTWRDTCALVVLEALSSGTPVVTTRRAGAAERIAPGAIGTVLDDPGDAVALAAAIESWLARIEAGAIDRGAIRAAVSGLEREVWLERMEELVRELASS